MVPACPVDLREKMILLCLSNETLEPSSLAADIIHIVRYFFCGDWYESSLVAIRGRHPDPVDRRCWHHVSDQPACPEGRCDYSCLACPGYSTDRSQRTTIFIEQPTGQSCPA